MVIFLSLLVWGAEIVLPALSAYAAPINFGAVSGAIAYAGHKAVEAFNSADGDGYSPEMDYANYAIEREGSYEKVEKTQQEQK